jgi:fructokinase
MGSDEGMRTEDVPGPAVASPPAAVLVVGECLVDLAPSAAPAATTPPAAATAGRVPAQPTATLSSAPSARYFVAMPGGGPANVAVGLARLGVRAAFAGRFSRSGFGPWLRQHLLTNEVDLRPSIDAPEPATLAVVTLNERGQASYTFYGPETADWQWADAELPRPPGAAAVHTGSLAATFQPGAAVLSRWLSSLRGDDNVLISFDPNVRPGFVDDLDAYRLRVEGMISSSHIVKASNEDIDAIYPGAVPLDVAHKWLSQGPVLVAVTEGERGAVAVHASGLEVRCAPPPVTVVDTIGAGDAFTSGLLAYLAAQDLLSPAGVARLNAAQLEAAVVQAVTVSALTCTRPGADPPDRHRLTAFRREEAHRSPGRHPL